MLLVDGVGYKLSKMVDEDELEGLVETQAKQIFGASSLYFRVKTKLRSMGGIGSIPDGYVISLSKPHRWYIVEIELSSHDLYSHILTQLARFITGIGNNDSRQSVIEALYQSIQDDQDLRKQIIQEVGTRDIHKFISDVLQNKPELIIIIDEKTQVLTEVCSILDITQHIIEFRAFEKDGDRRRDVFQFDSLMSTSLRTTKPLPKAQTEKQSARPISKLGLKTRYRPFLYAPRSTYIIPFLESIVELGGKATTQEALIKIHEKMRPYLTHQDYEILLNNRARWQNSVRWTRQNMKMKGYLKEDSPRGIWEITNTGRQHLAKVKTK